MSLTEELLRGEENCKVDCKHVDTSKEIYSCQFNNLLIRYGFCVKGLSLDPNIGENSCFVNNPTDLWAMHKIDILNRKELESMDKSLFFLDVKDYIISQKIWLTEDEEFFVRNNGRIPEEVEHIIHYGRSSESKKYRVMYALMHPESSGFNPERILKYDTNPEYKRSLDFTLRFFADAELDTFGRTLTDENKVPYMDEMKKNSFKFISGRFKNPLEMKMAEHNLGKLYEDIKKYT